MGRREVQVISGPACKPCSNGCAYLGSIVVHHDMHLCCRWKAGIQMVQKFLEFARAMTSKTFSHDTAGGYVQGRKQGRGPMALVVVASTLRLSWLHWQNGLRAIQGLNLTLLVHTKYQRMVGRVHV